jgi:glucose/mannose transport system substrate-binding protein
MASPQRWLKILGPLAILAILLAACGSQPSTGGTGVTSAPAAEATSAPATGGDAATAAPATGGDAATAAPAASEGGGRLEIFSWWTNGGEADGLNAMFDVYKGENDGVEVVNATVAGGAGTNAKAVLQTRLAGNDPPDSWQVHAGRETLSYVQAGQMEPLTEFFKEQGFDKAMPPFLLEQITIDGEIWTVPVNIHRSNVMWYNIKVFEENGLTPPKTVDEFFTVAETLKGKGITPLAVGGNNKFEASHLFESVLLATYGPDDYPKLFDGTTTMWEDPRAEQAIATMKRMLEFSNEDRAAIGWSDAAQLVVDGKAAMTIMGDWAHGYFLSKDLQPNVDYGYAAAPGTEGVFMWLSDSFGLAKGAPNPDQAKAWLAVAGSKEGQDAFNPKKGSIPARTDADKSKYDEYLQSAIDDFGSLKLAPSAAHGAATTNAFQAAFHNSLEVFSSDLDERTLLQTLKDATADNNK